MNQGTICAKVYPEGIPIKGNNYVLAPKMKGGHIGFSADPGRRRRRDSFLNFLEFYQTCMDTSLGQAKELIKFW